MMTAVPRADERVRLSVFAVAVMVAMVSSLLPPAPVHATHEDPASRGLAMACPPRQVPDPGFDDIGDNTHEAAIACTAAWNIAEGRTFTLYGPAGQTRRDQMASLIVRMLDAAGVAVSPDAPQAFADVPPGNVHSDAVNTLAQLGVVVGRSADAYQPAHPVRRDQMASFISRAVEQVLGDALTADHQWFADVDGTNVHAEAVDGLAAAGIVQGQDAQARRYGPDLYVRRDAMASFVGRTLDLLAAEGAITPPPPRLVAARATVVGTDGAPLGEVVVAGPPSGALDVRVRLEGLPPGGVHGFHIHDTGACTPDFAAAGGHYNPDGQPHGSHAGDLPVLLVADDGTADARFTTDRASMEEVMAGDGSAVIIHAAPDNYANIPERYGPAGPDETTLATGDAGARIGCGVLQASNLPPPVEAPPPPDARAEIVDTDGAPLGEVVFTDQSNGQMHVRARHEGLPRGSVHGFHIHDTGACTPDFAAAGGHYNPEGEPHGEHAGDLPVLLTREDGTANAHFTTDRVTADGLLAGDGTAIVVHAASDDYANIPERYAPGGPDETTLATGDAGARIGCGVVQAAPQPR